MENTKNFFCNKRQYLLLSLDSCNECFKNEQTGFSDKKTCQEFNLTYKETIEYDSN